jgi:hypothetical protein
MVVPLVVPPALCTGDRERPPTGRYLHHALVKKG